MSIPMGYSRGSLGIVIGSAVIGAALVVCVLLLSSTAVKIRGMGQTLDVTGAAYKPITSDIAVWEGRVRVYSPDLEAASVELKADLEEVRRFLRGEGIADREFEIGPVSISRRMNRDRELTGYELSQTIRMEVSDVGRINNIARNSSSLIERGVEFESRPPRYIFTGLEPLKLEMIKAATENARMRAEQLAGPSGRKVGAPYRARVGVFQIRPKHSQDVSDYGISDQSSLEKEIVCTVHIEYAIE